METTAKQLSANEFMAIPPREFYHRSRTLVIAFEPNEDAVLVRRMFPEQAAFLRVRHTVIYRRLEEMARAILLIERIVDRQSNFITYCREFAKGRSVEGYTPNLEKQLHAITDGHREELYVAHRLFTEIPV